MKKVIFEGKEIKVFRTYELKDPAKYVLNKLNKKIGKKEAWSENINSDYEKLKKLLKKYTFMIILNEIPKKYPIYDSGYSYQAYKLNVECTCYRTIKCSTLCIAFIAK